MGVFYTEEIGSFKKISKLNCQLVILSRNMPLEADNFFKNLSQIPFSIFTEVSKKTILNDIKQFLQDDIPEVIKTNLFYKVWIKDICSLCKLYCDIENSTHVSIWLGSKRGCRRYHIDDVPQRLLVTYSGQGTEWISDEFADRDAYKRGEPNDRILKNKSKKKYIDKWDVALFKGGPNGLLHRTPDSALNNPSILMRLDHPGYWERVNKQIYKNINSS